MKQAHLLARHWLFVGVLTFGLFLCTSHVFAAGNDRFTLNFVNADIAGVVRAMSKITGKNFVLDPRVKGTVNIISARPISRKRVYDVFLAALRLQGFAAVEDDGVVDIVPASEAKLFNSPTIGPHQISHGRGDTIATRVFKLKYEPAAEVLSVLRPLVSPGNAISASPSNNTLIVTDYASNLRRIATIIQAVDQPAGTGPVVIPLHYASAVDVAQTVNRLFSGANEGARRGARLGINNHHITVVADVRSNALLASTNDPALLTRLRNLVAILDTPTSTAGNIHVVYLKNAQATQVAKTLRAIYMGTATSAPSESLSQSQSQSQSQTPPHTGAGLGATPTAMSLGTSAGLPINSGFGSSSENSSGTLAPGIIQADPATNALIIKAPDAIYDSLRAAIAKLDVRRKEVYVQALIAEITSDKAAEFGIQWQSLHGVNSNSASPFGGTNFGNPSQNILDLSQNPGSAGNGLNIGIVKGVVTIPGINGPVLNLGLLVRALESDNDANILSTPTLLTLNNEPANIVVGQNVPFVTGQYAVSASATTPTPFQTIERQDVGLMLSIKPQITQGGTVRLQIHAEVSSIENSTNALGIITNKRSVDSTVLVKNGQIVAIGGLIQNSVTNGLQKVPLLGDLPIVGGLFRYDSREHTKTNLMVFLQPTIVRNAKGTNALTKSRYNYILGVQRKTKPGPNALLPEMAPPTLPPLSLPATSATQPKKLLERHATPSADPHRAPLAPPTSVAPSDVPSQHSWW